MTSILLSVRPEYALNILNGNKTLELRKTIPHGFVGWVYVYVTKSGKQLYDFGKTINKGTIWQAQVVKKELLNGTIPMRFWFDEYKYLNWLDFILGYMPTQCTLQKLCLTEAELDAYGNHKDLYAWHIKKLEIFDKPMELKDFTTIHIPDDAIIEREENGEEYFYRKGMQLWHNYFSRLTRAPQSWQYVEVKGETK